MSDKHHVSGHDDLNRVFDDGTIFTASREDLERYLCALGTINILSDPVRAKAVVRALTINHVQMARAINGLEQTTRELSADSKRMQRLIMCLTVVGVVAGIVQAVAAVMLMRR